jgi:hypothetical protein
MLRHKATIQCSRLAFGFAGIFDQDEAERIAERDITPGKTTQAIAEQARQQPEDSPERDAIVQRLEAIANTGDMGALVKEFEAIGKPGRKAVGANDWQRIKDMAEFASNADPVIEASGHE